LKKAMGRSTPSSKSLKSGSPARVAHVHVDEHEVRVHRDHFRRVFGQHLGGRVSPRALLLLLALSPGGFLNVVRLPTPRRGGERNEKECRDEGDAEGDESGARVRARAPGMSVRLRRG
jgi:hypothetical protein